MNITQRSREDYFYFSIYVLCFSLPFDYKLSNNLIALSVILWIYSLPRTEIKTKWKTYRYYIVLFSLPFFINGIGLIHSDNISTGMGRFEAKLAQLIFPVIILLSNLGKDQFRKAGYYLCFGVLASSLICLGVDYVDFLRTPGGVMGDFFFYKRLLQPLNLHANFYPLFVCFAALFIIHDAAFEKHSRAERILLVVFFLFTILMVLLIQSRAPIAALLTILVIGTFYWVIRNRQVQRSVKISILAIGMILIGIISTNKSFYSRFSFPVKNIDKYVLADSANVMAPEHTVSIIEHVRCWYCATQVLSDYHFFTGFGTGDERDVLDQCYQSNGWEDMSKSRFSSHNEYLSSLMRNGLTELLVLIGILAIPFFQSLKSNYILYGAFILLWILVLFFSSLHRQSLISFYALFNAMFFKVMMQMRPAEQINNADFTS